MTRMYYHDAQACIVMFDMTYDSSLDICHKWKYDLHSKVCLDNGEPIPCVLVANKVGMRSGRMRGDQIDVGDT